MDGLLDDVSGQQTGKRGSCMERPVTRHAPATFTTDLFDPEHRFEAYREYTRSINDISIPRAARSDFAASTTNWVLGRIMIGVVRTPRMQLSRTIQQIRGDDLDHWVLRVSLSGEVASRAGERSYRSGPGDLVLESLAAPYEDQWTPGEWISVAFPRDMTPGLSQRSLDESIGPRRHAPARVLSSFLFSLVEELPRASPDDMARLTDATRAMIVSAVDEQGPPARSPSLARARVERAILANIASARLTPERIADIAGVSRSTLYRMFEGEGGVATHIRRLRLEGVRADLDDPAKREQPIARIAESWGFYCVSAFNRSFRAAFGMTPGDIRGQMAPPAPERRAARASRSRADLSSLLLAR
jgi:AraC-like DNA-binding protein